jgi:deoxyhypusine synthase
LHKEKKLPKEKRLFTTKVKAIEVRPKKSISQLLSDMTQTGFQGKSLGKIVDTFAKMLSDKDATILLGYAGSLSTTGQWKIINWLMDNGYIDILFPP